MGEPRLYRRKAIAHGTKNGYDQHYRRGEVACRACREAKSKVAREQYRSRGNIAKATPRAMAVRAARSKSVLDVIAEYKATHPCTDCGQTYPAEVMDFDHVRGDKVLNVSRMIKNRYGLPAILDEIAKCELVCANCHRIRTASRRRLRKPPGEAVQQELPL